MKTEPWWVCNACGEVVQKVGGSGGPRGQLAPKAGHRKICLQATYSMKQVPQRRKRQPPPTAALASYHAMGDCDGPGRCPSCGPRRR